MKWIWKVVFSTILIILKGWSEISLLESFGSLLVTSLVTVTVVAESSYKDFWEIIGKFVGNIPGGWCLKSSLVCGFKDMSWTRISSIDMGEGWCWDVAKHRIIE